MSFHEYVFGLQPTSWHTTLNILGMSKVVYFHVNELTDGCQLLGGPWTGWGWTLKRPNQD